MRRQAILVAAGLAVGMSWCGAGALGQTAAVTNAGASGAGSLASAIQQANAWAGTGPFTINFNGGLYITLTGELPIFNNWRGVVINGNGSTIDGGSVSNATGYRAFFFGVGGTEASVSSALVETSGTNWTVNNLTIRNANARGGTGGPGSGGGGAGFGGGAFVNAGTLTLNNVLFDGNRAVGGRGGDGTSVAGGVSSCGGGMGGEGGGLGGGGGGFGASAGGGGSGTGGVGGSNGGDGNYTGGARGGSGAGGTLGGLQGGGGGGSGGGGGLGAGGGQGFDGGFGGGGGSSGGPAQNGRGGFGGGGATGQPGGFGGGQGGGSFVSGSGGWGAGGAVFVRQGASVVLSGTTLQNNMVVAGPAGTPRSGRDSGIAGEAIGPGLFLAGSATVSVGAGQTQTISETIGGTTPFASASAGVVASEYVSENPPGNFTTYPNNRKITLPQAHTFSVNQWVTLSGMSVAGYNGTYRVAFTLDANSFGIDAPRIAQPATGMISSQDGVTGGLTKSGPGTLLLTGANTYTGATTISEGTLGVQAEANLGAASNPVVLNGGFLRIAGTSMSSTPRSLVVNSGGLDIAEFNNTFSLSGPIGGGGSLGKRGPGTLLLTAANTHTGGTLVEAGTLALARDAFALGTPVLTSDVTVNSGAFLRFDTNNNFGAHNSATGPNVIVNGGSVTNSGGYINALQNLTLNTGTIAALGEFGAYGAYSVRGTVTSTGSSTILLGPNRLTLGQDGDTEFNVLSGSTLFIGSTVANNVDGPGSLIKSGAGQLVLGVPNTYTGATTVNGGELGLRCDTFLTGAPALPVGAAAITVNPGARLRFFTPNTFGPHSTATGPDIVVNGGTVTNFGSHINALQNLTLNSGTLSAQGDGGAFGAFSVRGTLASTGGSTVDLGVYRLTLGQDGDTSFDVRSGTLSVNSPIADNVDGPGRLLKMGSGTMVLAAANTYSGGTTIIDGTLAITGPDRLGGGAVLFTTATLRTDAAMTIDRALTIGFGQVAFVDTNGSDVTAIGLVSGNGGFIKRGAGTLTLTNAANSQANNRIDGGVLSVASDAHLGSAGGPLFMAGGTLRTTTGFTTPRAMIVQFGSTAQVDTAGQTLVWNGGVVENAGIGGLNKLGAGTLVLGGASSFTGQTTVSGGTLEAANLVGRARVEAGAALSGGPGIGTLNLGQDLVLAPGSTLQLDYSLAGGLNHDRIVSSGALDLRDVSASQPVLVSPQGVGTLSSSARLVIGEFAGGILLPAAGGDSAQYFRVVANASGLNRVAVEGNRLVATGCRADFDDNGTRNVEDIFRFLSAWFAGEQRADIDGSGTRDVADIFAFLSLWFAGC